MSSKKYHIYSHADADGGIAAAIFSEFIHSMYSKYDWEIEVHPVNHGSKHGEWHLQNIVWPCAILDFTLHPSLLSDRFLVNGRKEVDPRFREDDKNICKNDKQIPKCYWIDHHPTGSSFSFLSAENLNILLPNIATKWDTSAISTPGLFRTHHEELGLPKNLIREYEEFIDLAEIIDGALYMNCAAAHDFSSSAVKLQTLFNPSHQLIDKTALYKRLVRQIWKNPCAEDLFDSDPIYPGIIAHEQKEFHKLLHSYEKVTKLKGKVAFANFFDTKKSISMGRFIPYLIHEKSNYALHIIPRGKDGGASISCGVNPWNKPMDQTKHLGNYFATHFSGGGHAFVAGGKITAADLPQVEKLIEYLNT